MSVYSTMTTMRPYSTPATLTKLDKRTVESRLLAKTRRDLIAHVGGHPSATESMLIERAAQLTLRIAVMDRKLSAPGADVEALSKVYLAWSGSLMRSLARLGMKAAPCRVPSLAEIMAAPAPHA